MTIQNTLYTATTLLQPTTTTPQLDAELLLAHVTQTSRQYLYAHPTTLLAPPLVTYFMQLIARRAKEPIAYLLGEKEFWSLPLTVSPAVLIPRPETELLVEIALNIAPHHDRPVYIADLGTGSGAIALALAREQPEWQIHASDISLAALSLAQHNACKLGCTSVTFHHGTWCQALPRGMFFDMIVANPPYLSLAEWQQATRANRSMLKEPKLALIASQNGYAALHTIIATAHLALRTAGYLALEHGAQQAKKVRALFQQAGYRQVATHCDLAGQQRVTVGQKN